MLAVTTPGLPDDDDVAPPPPQRSSVPEPEDDTLLSFAISVTVVVVAGDTVLPR